MATKQLVKTEAALTAERTFCDAIPIEGKFNVSITGTFVATLTVQRRFVSDTAITGTTTSTSATKLVDTVQDFVTDGVRPYDWVHNTTDDTHAMITAVDTSDTLSINGDIMTSDEAYTIERWWDLIESGQFTTPADSVGEEIEGGVFYRIGIRDSEYTSGTAYVRISK